MIEISTGKTLDESRVIAQVAGLPSGDTTVVYESNVALSGNGQAWLPAFLPVLMNITDQARLTDPQDQTGLTNAEVAQALLRRWYPELRHVTIDAKVSPAASSRSRGVGCFFSGGVDSFYSALERQSEITHLIFVHGFDLPFDDSALATKSVEAIREAAAELGKELLTVRTDIRKVSDRWSRWGEQYHGAGLASIGLLLADHVGHVLIPSSYQTDELFPWASHPDLDPLWSTSAVTFEHHGVERYRTEKVGTIADNPIAMKHLRVCWENRDGEYNCGRCEKCIRTMISLRVFDALERCQTLPDVIDLRNLRSVHSSQSVATFAASNLELLTQHGISDPQLERALRAVIRPSPFWEFVRRTRSKVRGD